MEIQRDIIDLLRAWQTSTCRKPLVLQGARQVGKSWILHKFGREYFKNIVHINFDTMPELKQDFARTKEPNRIIRLLSMVSGRQIEPQNTLVILDEIQECNDALNSMKYFCEQAPEYAIACAGSLLGVALNRSGCSFPVGKVDFMTMQPLSFCEYLRCADAPLADAVQSLDAIESIPEIFHFRLLDHYKIYLALGGMPEAVSRYMETHDVGQADSILDNILLAYSLDFSKHVSNKDIPRIFRVWGNLQDQLARENRKFRYADIQPGARAREYEAAIEWLSLAGLVHRVYDIEMPRLPLSFYKNSSAFKLYLSDTGLLRRKFRLDFNAVAYGNQLLKEFKGALSENHVLLALTRHFGNEHFYWTSGNTAEIEFILQYQDHIIPIEVKSGDNVKARSLSEFRRKYEPEIAVRFSTRNLRLDNGLLNIPIYLADRLAPILHLLS